MNDWRALDEAYRSLARSWREADRKVLDIAPTDQVAV